MRRCKIGSIAGSAPASSARRTSSVRAPRPASAPVWAKRMRRASPVEHRDRSLRDRCRVMRQAPSRPAPAERAWHRAANGIGVILVHMRDDARLGLEQRLGALQQEREARPAARSTMRPKPPMIMGALRLRAAKRRSRGSRHRMRPRRLARQKAAPHRLFADLLGPA